MRLGALSLLIVFMGSSSICCVAQQMPTAGSPVFVKILVPVSGSQIGKIKLGGQMCRLQEKEPSNRAPILLLNLVNSISAEVEKDQINEIRSFVSQSRSDFKLEVWSSLGGRYEIAAPFPRGWVSFIPNGSYGGKSHFERNLPTDHAELLELIARRFTRRGPVRVFLLSESFSVDVRDSHSYNSGLFNETSLEAFWPLVGDSGLIVYPVIIPKRPKRPPVPTHRRTFSASLFGTQEIVAGGVPGSALAEAFAESEKGTVITIEVPARKYTKFRRAPKLEVYSKDGKKLWERPFVAGGEPVDEIAANDAFAMALSRVVKPLVIQRAGIVPTCGGETADSSEEKYIGLDGVIFPESQPALAKVWVTTRPNGRDNVALTERGRETTLLRHGNTACLGPIPIVKDSELYVYYPEGPWLAAVIVGGIR